MPRRITDEADARIGRNIARLRSLRGISRRKLAEALPCPISQQQAAKYEDGRSCLPAGLLPGIASILDCDILEFFA
jgi:transcriptional regulator with XRE-family HTH domain